MTEENMAEKCRQVIIKEVLQIATRPLASSEIVEYKKIEENKHLTSIKLVFGDDSKLEMVFDNDHE